mgnify:CR=1 FL=1
MTAADEVDPYIWLEEVERQPRRWPGPRNRTKKTTAELEGVKQYKPIYERTRQILDSQDASRARICSGDMVYNFWQDKDHPRGIWRRATLASYSRPARSGRP